MNISCNNVFNYISIICENDEYRLCRTEPKKINCLFNNFNNISIDCHNILLKEEDCRVFKYYSKYLLLVIISLSGILFCIHYSKYIFILFEKKDININEENIISENLQIDTECSDDEPTYDKNKDEYEPPCYNQVVY